MFVYYQVANHCTPLVVLQLKLQPFFGGGGVIESHIYYRHEHPAFTPRDIIEGPGTGT